jgi:hypothetical protein
MDFKGVPENSSNEANFRYSLFGAHSISMFLAVRVFVVIEIVKIQHRILGNH